MHEFTCTSMYICIVNNCAMANKACHQHSNIISAIHYIRTCKLSNILVDLVTDVFNFGVDLHRPKKARGNEKDKLDLGSTPDGSLSFSFPLAFFGLCKSTPKLNTYM